VIIVLSVEVQPADGDRAIVRVSGELDVASASEFRQVVSDLLNTATAPAIGLDLADLTFVDSTGVGTLVVAQRICRQVGVDLTVVALSPFVAYVLQVAGVSELFGVAESLAPANE
jgi:anti-anti-sigma factor